MARNLYEFAYKVIKMPNFYCSSTMTDRLDPTGAKSLEKHFQCIVGYF